MPTISLDDDVHRELVRLRTRWRLKGLNEVVKRLLDHHDERSRTMFGSDPGLPRLDRDMRTKMWE